MIYENIRLSYHGDIRYEASAQTLSVAKLYSLHCYMLSWQTRTGEEIIRHFHRNGRLSVKHTAFSSSIYCTF